MSKVPNGVATSPGGAVGRGNLDRREFLKLTGVGLAAVLASRMTIRGAPSGPAPVRPDPANLDVAYLKHLRATKGILDIRTIYKSGAGPNWLDVVVVSAGFKAEQMGEFHRLCASLAKTLLSVPPWQRYRSLVNVHAVLVDDASVDDTRLHVSGYEGEVLGCDDGIAVEYGRYAANAAATVVIHNSSYSTASTGTWGVAAINKGDVVQPAALVHELGHGFAGLGDEYIQRNGPFDEPPESLQITVNVTPVAQPALCKWHYWTAPEWPGIFGTLKLPQNVNVANFEGAGWPTKIYRPEETCLMRGDRDTFCVVCSEALEGNFFRYLDLFQAVAPVAEDLVLWKGECVDFQVNALDLLQQPPAWLQSKLDLYLDGGSVASSDRGRVSFRLRSDKVAPGWHHLGANLNIQSDTIRRDFGFLSGNRGWRVKVVASAKPEISVKPLVSVGADGAVDVPVRIRRAKSSLFELKMTDAPQGAVLENGRFRWKPAGAAGSWRVVFAAWYEQQRVVTASMELQVSRKGGEADVPALPPLEPVDAVTGQAVKLQLKAGVKDGGHLLFEPVQAPEGVALNGYSGELAWVPDVGRAGPQRMRFRVKNGPAACETEVVFWVRRAATPSPVSYCNDYIPRTLERLKRLEQSPILYCRLFETLRLLRDRYAPIHQAALAAAERLYRELGPELKNQCLQELPLQAWAFTDKPAVLKWLRGLADAGKSEQAGILLSRLNEIASYNAKRLPAGAKWMGVEVVVDAGAKQAGS